MSLSTKLAAGSFSLGIAALVAAGACWAPTLVPAIHSGESAESTSDLPTLTLPPCPVEDADDCYWDAARMGNGQGTSFVTIDGVTYYPEADQ